MAAEPGEMAAELELPEGLESWADEVEAAERNRESVSAPNASTAAAERRQKRGNLGNGKGCSVHASSKKVGAAGKKKRRRRGGKRWSDKKKLKQQKHASTS